LGTALVAVASLFVGREAQLFFPLLVIAVGFYFLYSALRPRLA
jgi:hypothetical protein